MPFKYFSILTKILFAIFKPVINHVKVLYAHFDPVLDAPVEVQRLDQLPEYRKQRIEKDKAKHRFFLFPFGIFVFNILDSLFVMAADDFDYYHFRMQELFYHKMYPERFWPQSDLIVFSIILCSLAVYYNLWQGEWLDDRFNMYFLGIDGSTETRAKELIVNNKGLIFMFLF